MIRFAILAAAAIGMAMQAEERPLLVANYYVWYETAAHPKSPWAGWTRPEATTNAKAIAAQRAGEPPPSSAARPLVGPYASSDPIIAGWHIQLAKNAGIDAFFVSWWGKHKNRDTNFDNGILAAADAANFKIAILDERAQFHTDFSWYKNFVVDTLKRYKNRRCYLHIDGRPVYYLYQVASEPSLTPARFIELKEHVESQVGPVYWIVDKIAHNPIAQRENKPDEIKKIPADWLHTKGIDAFGFYSTFSNFRAHRYEDLVGKFQYMANQAHLNGKKMLLPVHPGHNNAHFRDAPYVMPRRDGQTLRDYLSATTAAKADIVMITSWNEWPETTVIEPSASWTDPYHDLRIIAQWRGAAFTPPPLPNANLSAKP